VRRRIARAFVVRETVLPPVTADDIHGFGAAAPLVLEMQEFHVAVGAEFEAHYQFVADGYQFEYELVANKLVKLGKAPTTPHASLAN
jgi:hypothetical protein